MWYLCYFFHRHLDYRLPEVESLAKLVAVVAPGESLQWRLPEGHHPDSPFWFVNLPSEAVAKQIASRAILVKGLYEVWGEGSTYEEVDAGIGAYPDDRKLPYIGPETSFRFVVDGFGRAFSTDEQRKVIERFSFIPFQGPVKLQDAEQKFWVIEAVAGGEGNNGLPPLMPRYIYFGREVGISDRTVVNRYALPKRKFLGPTSMDAEVALLIANQALARPGTLVYDPFVGTGSILVAAAHFGAMTMGADIDVRILRQGRAPDCNIWSNFEQYGLQPPLTIIRGDNHRTPWREDLREVLDAIVCDPPYGVRAGGRKSGGRKMLNGLVEEYVIPDEMREGHIPSTAPYTLAECLHDLLDAAARLLVIGGRLVYFLPKPVVPDGQRPEEFPKHPCLSLVSTSKQILTLRWTRHLVTMEKTKGYDDEMARRAAEVRVEFRTNHAKLMAEAKQGDLHALMFAPVDIITGLPKKCTVQDGGNGGGIAEGRHADDRVIDATDARRPWDGARPPSYRAKNI